MALKLTTLPQELILEILDNLDEHSILTTRLTSRLLSAVATSCARGKLRFRAKSTRRMKELQDRLADSDPWASAFTMVVFNASWMLAPHKAKLSVHATNFLHAATDLLEAVGPQLTGLELVSTTKREELPRLTWDMKTDLQDYFFRAVTILLFYAGNERGLLPNVTSLSVEIADDENISHLALSSISPADLTFLRWRNKPAIVALNAAHRYTSFQKQQAFFNRYRALVYRAPGDTSFPFPEPMRLWDSIKQLNVKTYQAMSLQGDPQQGELNCFISSVMRSKMRDPKAECVLVHSNGTQEHIYTMKKQASRGQPEMILWRWVETATKPPPLKKKKKASTAKPRM